MFMYYVTVVVAMLSALAGMVKLVVDEVKEKKLRKIADDDDFVQGVFGFTKTKEDRKRVLEYINNDIDVSYENILLLSLDLCR